MKRLTLYLLALGAFLTGVAELVVGGILNVIAEDLNLSVGLAGQLITAYSVAFAIGTPVIISLTSRLPRKQILTTALAVFIAGCLASYVSSGLGLLIFSRIVLGMSAGVFLVAAISSIAKLVPAEETGRAISLIALGFGSAMALGVPLGIAITEWRGWQTIFAVLGLLSILVLLGLLRLLPEIEGDAPAGFKQQFAVLRHPVIVTGLLVTFFLNMSNSIVLTYLTPLLQSVLHLTTAEVGLTMLALGFIGILGSRAGGIGVDRWGSVRMIAATLMLSFLSLSMVPMLVAPVWAALALIMLWIASTFMNAPPLQMYFIQQAPHASNLVLGMNTSVIHLGLALGAGLGGAAANTAGTVLYHPWMAGGGMLLALLSALASFAVVRRRETGTAA